MGSSPAEEDLGQTVSELYFLQGTLQLGPALVGLELAPNKML